MFGKERRHRMNYTGGQRKQSRMVANYDDPWVSVGLLAQDVFCQRAGIIHNENPQMYGEEEIYHASRGLRRIFYSFHQIWRSFKMTLFVLGGEIVLFALFIVGSTSSLIEPIW